MDIKSGKTYPSKALSNFTPHPFVFRGVECASMEGLLQATKVKNNFEMQKHVCSLVGREAKKSGKKKKLEANTDFMVGRYRYETR